MSTLHQTALNLPLTTTPTRGLATTKFEPTYARMAFPSFDEPSFKATYTVSVVKPKDKEYIVLGNMPVQVS